MKNKFKILAAVIISGILFTTIGVYATYQFLAKDISFTSNNANFKSTNVNDALNELYDININNKIYGYPIASSTGSWSVGIYAPYMDDVEYEGYGLSNTNGWGTTDKELPGWSGYTFSKKVVMHNAIVSYGVTTSTQWMQEGDLTIQASNDNFTTAVDLVDIHLSFDEELLKQGLYGIKWSGSLNNDTAYYSYRVIAKTSAGYTGINKLQLSKIYFY